MKTNFNFDVFAVVLSLVLLDLATLRPAQQEGAELATALPSAARSVANRPVSKGHLVQPLLLADSTRAGALGRPQRRVTAAAMRR